MDSDEYFCEGCIYEDIDVYWLFTLGEGDRKVCFGKIELVFGSIDEVKCALENVSTMKVEDLL